jgi:hypothetical protein
LYGIDVLAALKFEMLAFLQPQPTKDRDVHLEDKSGERRTGITARVGDKCHQ